MLLGHKNIQIMLGKRIIFQIYRNPRDLIIKITEENGMLSYSITRKTENIYYTQISLIEKSGNHNDLESLLLGLESLFMVILSVCEKERYCSKRKDIVPMTEGDIKKILEEIRKKKVVDTSKIK